MKRSIQIEPGYPVLPGVNRVDDRYIFTAEIPKDAQAALVLYKKNAKKPFMEIPFPDEKRMGKMRSVSLRGITAEQIQYNLRINGNIVQDPYAYHIYGKNEFGAKMDGEDEHKIRCGLLLEEEYAWEEDQVPDIPYEEMILYELHVRGYTKQAKIPAKKRGTYAGLTEMIPYWKELGINVIELMPAYEFPEVSLPEKKTDMVYEKRQEGKVNFWGYVPGFYFSLKESYCAAKNPEKEFKDLIKALHREKIACIMQFYFPKEVDPQTALRALQFWKICYHVDGFHLIGDGVVKELFLHDGILSDGKLFFTDLSAADHSMKCMRECAAADYNRGFWCDMRRMLKSDPGMVPSVIYHIQKKAEMPASVNYMASHDGFTMTDMVSYNDKHNDVNGENNRDGNTEEFSWNCGEEGSAKTSFVRRIRQRQMKNAAIMLFCSPGIPMLYGGDEIGNSQGGNSNAYCQDNPVGWIDWDGIRKNEKWLEFVKAAIAFRKAHPALYRLGDLQEGEGLLKGIPKLSFHSEKSWYVSGEETSRLLGIMYCGSFDDPLQELLHDCVYVAYNFHWENRTIALPNLPEGMSWKKIVDTFRDEPGESFMIREKEYKKALELGPRSIVILIGQ